MVEHDMPVTLDQMGTTVSSFLDDTHHALKIMKKRDRYSILEHLNVSDQDLSDTLRNLGYY